MRPPLAPLELLRYQSGKDTDILNEYYVPMQHFVPFMDKFRQILLDNDMNVMSSTVRYVSPNATPVLAYAPTEPVFAIIQMSNVGLDSASQAKTADVTRQLVDAAIEYGGTYYLTYQLYPTPAQLLQGVSRARARRLRGSGSTIRARYSPASSTRGMGMPKHNDWSGMAGRGGQGAQGAEGADGAAASRPARRRRLAVRL